jgi:hypothetical protein
MYIDHLKTEEELLDEKLKFNVRVMQRALKASELEKQIHKEVSLI